MSETPVPIGLTKTDDRHLVIKWSDGIEQAISVFQLRKGCECATCIEKRTGAALKKDEPTGLLPVLSAAEARPLEIIRMRPVGNYAYNIQFSDDHTTGIYTFELLRSLAVDSSDIS